MEIKYLSDGIEVGGEFVSIDCINQRCSLVKIEDNNYGIIKIEWPSSRGFDGIVEKFVSTIENLKAIKSLLIGKNIYFGEIAGKHSDVYGDMEEKEIEIIVDVGEVRSFLLSNPTGHTYTHSFLYTFLENECDDCCSQITKEEYDIINGIINETK